MKKRTKRKTHKKKGLSSPFKRKTTHRRKRKGLSDMFNPTMAMNAAKNTLLASGGGFGAVIVNKNILPAKWGKPGQVITGLLGGFLLETFSMPILGASFSGGMAALAFQNGLLSEMEEIDEDNAEFTDAKALSEAPLFLDEEGNPMVLEEDANGAYYRYLSENEQALLDEN